MSGRFSHESDGSSGDPAGFFPTAGVRVTVSLDGHTVASAVSGADGRYAIASIAAGTYDVRFSGALSDMRFKITITSFDAVVGFSSLDHAALSGSGVNSNVTAKIISLPRFSDLDLTGSSAINGHGSSHADGIFGNAKSNILNGNAGNDILRGEGGNDRLTGGLGADHLAGGAGRDIFDYNSIRETGRTAATRDEITDFAHGIDRIDLSTIDANASAAGNAAFHWLGRAAFDGERGALHFQHINRPGTFNDQTIVSGDVNGDRVADFQIELDRLVSLTRVDFIL
jgi:serralysin